MSALAPYLLMAWGVVAVLVTVLAIVATVRRELRDVLQQRRADARLRAQLLAQRRSGGCS